MSGEVSDPLEAARALAPLVRQHADEGEELRRLPTPVAEALRDAGLFRLCVPRAYGGSECDPMTLVRAIAQVSEADGAAGWCVMIASTTSSLAARLAPVWATEIFGDPRSVAGGVFAPNGKGVRVDGGHRVSGQWPWGSGTSHCTWILGGTLTDTDEFHLMFAPAAEVELLDTWYSSGLRGTGSTDFRMTDVFVPEGRSVQPFASGVETGSPLARFPNFNLLAAGVAAVALGIGRRAIDEIVALAQGKRPLFSSKTLAASSLAQVDVARAEAAVGAATAFLLDELSVAWDAVLAGGHIELGQRARVRIACSHAAQEAARAVDLAYHLGGGSSVYSANVLQRCFRDVHTVTQHLMVSTRILETAGKVILGIDADTSTL
ncbi:MAG: acyl-CoA dehydrogenase family protein [Acidimicrobiia bacterium]